MKKINFVMILVFSIPSLFLSSCKKITEDPPATPSCNGTMMIGQEYKVVTGGSNPVSYKKDYKYNNSKQLVKIEYTYLPNLYYTVFDTIIYSGNNVSSVKSYDVNDLVNPTLTYNYYYTGSRIDSVNDIGTNANGPYSKMVKFTFTSGVLSAQTVQYISGTPTGGSTDISSIVFANGNISSATLSSGPATFINEITAPNPFLGLNNTIDILKLFNVNNCSSAYLTSSPTTKIVSLIYTYENGRVKTITDNDGYGGTRVNTFTYVCL